LLFADDAVGGFFALDGGAFGPDVGQVWYWPPDDLSWMSLEVGFTEFLQWSLSKELRRFYRDLRWRGWRRDMPGLSGDRCYSFYPFLWTKEGSIARSHRAQVPAAEAFDLKVDVMRQITERTGPRDA